MSNTTAKVVAAEAPLLFKEHQVTLRQELKLTDQQAHKIRTLYASDRKHEYLDILPPTIVVHKKLATEKLDLRQCVYITGTDAQNLKVFAAPKFCCRRPPDRAALCPLYNGYVNMEKSDLDVVQTSTEKPSIDVLGEANTNNCMTCFKKYSTDTLEHSLFSLSCGHIACRACWLTYAKWCLWRHFGPFPCMNGNCARLLSIGAASAIFDAATLGMMREFQWRTKLAQKGNVRCAGCSKWLQRSNFYRRGVVFGCACGCFTCVRCGKLEHSSLTCADAALWGSIKKDENAASRALDELSLDAAALEQCLAPRKLVDSPEWAANIGAISLYNSKHGRDVAHCMSLVAGMLEHRSVQQLAGRKSLPPDPEIDFPRDEDANWAGLERYFYDILAQNCYHKENFEILCRYREAVLFI